MGLKIVETQSLCPICLGNVPAWYEQRGQDVFFCKDCPEHGSFKVLFWRDAEMFIRWHKQGVHALPDKSLSSFKRGCPFDCGLCAEHEGRICTAVLELTYQCNLNCPVCFADTEKERFDPDLGKIDEMYRTAYEYGGFCSIQLSGGEPTLREDLPAIIRIGKKLGFPHIQVNTNGLRLAQDLDYAARLADAGADLVYLQFDGTADDIYLHTRGRKLLAEKYAAIEHCGRAGLGVLLVPTVIPGINLDSLGDIVRFAKERMPVVKGIHFQPVSYFGRFPAGGPCDERRCGLSDIIHALAAQTAGEISASHLVPRKRCSPHCAFSGLYYLTPEGKLHGITQAEQNSSLDETTDFPKKANIFTNSHWRMRAPEGKTDGQSPMRKFCDRLNTHTLAISAMGFQDVWNIDLARLRGCCVAVIGSDNSAVPLCAFHLTSVSGKRLYRNA